MIELITSFLWLGVVFKVDLAKSHPSRALASNGWPRVWVERLTAPPPPNPRNFYQPMGVVSGVTEEQLENISQYLFSVFCRWHRCQFKINLLAADWWQQICSEGNVMLPNFCFLLTQWGKVINISTKSKKRRYRMYQQNVQNVVTALPKYPFSQYSICLCRVQLYLISFSLFQPQSCLFYLAVKWTISDF